MKDERFLEYLTENYRTVSLNREVNSSPEHVVGVEGGQPVAIGIRIVVTRPPAVTLYKGHLAEIFQT